MNRAITVRQPWPALMLAGAKHVEFRTKAVPRHLIGRPMYLHAGKARMHWRDVEKIYTALTKAGPRPGRPEVDELDRALAEPVLTRYMAYPEEFAHGALVARITFGEAIFRRDFQPFLGWPIAHLEPLADPIPASGAQGFWVYPRGREQ